MLLVHMGGRIYDPTLGRFLQADPFIQAPKNSQNYNRYSYVLNNPMSYTDPSGYNFLKKWVTGVLRGLARVPILNTAVQISIGIGCGGAAAQCLAIYNGLQTYALTGSLSASLRSAAISYATGKAFSEIGAHFDKLNAGAAGDGLSNFGGNWLKSGQIARQISAHALVGGISAELQGGKFGHGFFSAGVTKGIGGVFLPGGDELTSGQIAQGAAVSAVIGGTASKISGGKFANGASTGAFQYLFNQAVGQSIRSRQDAVARALDNVQRQHRGHVMADTDTAIESEGTYVYEVEGEGFYTDGKVNFNALKFTDTHTGSFGGGESAPACGWWCGTFSNRQPFDRVSDVVISRPSQGQMIDFKDYTFTGVKSIYIWSPESNTTAHYTYTSKTGWVSK